MSLETGRKIKDAEERKKWKRRKGQQEEIKKTMRKDEDSCEW